MGAKKFGECGAKSLASEKLGAHSGLGNLNIFIPKLQITAVVSIGDF